MEQSHVDEKPEPVLYHADGSLIKIITTWKEYPIEQWKQELTIGRIQQAFFIPPTKDVCGGEFHKILLGEYGWILQCDMCNAQMPLGSHQVFWTNHEQIIHAV